MTDYRTTVSEGNRTTTLLAPLLLLVVQFEFRQSSLSF